MPLSPSDNTKWRVSFSEPVWVSRSCRISSVRYGFLREYGWGAVVVPVGLSASGIMLVSGGILGGDGQLESANWACRTPHSTPAIENEPPHVGDCVAAR